MFFQSFKHAVWLWFTVGYCVIVLIGPTNVSGNLSSEDEEDYCRRLPLNAERSRVDGESQMNIVSLLNGGSDAMKARISNGSEFYPDEAILILGNTGCGKTTLTQIITSNLSRIHAVLTYSGDMVIVDDDERIGAPSTVSRTLVPELVPLSSSENMTTYFYDCPGFDDTRGPEQDLAANFFMNQIIRKVKRVKLLFLVKHSSVVQGHDRLGFDLLVKHATEFVRNLGPFEKSIGLVVTKVKGFSEATRKALKDKTILKGISEFISNYNQTLHQILKQKQTEQERNVILKKIEFVNILLQKDENNNHDKLAFSRSPDSCGPLNTVASVLRTKEMVTHLYNNLEYVPVGTHENFGYTLKENTLLSIQHFAKQINNETTKMLEKTIANFSDWFEQKKLNVSNSVNGTIALMEKSKPAIEMLTKNFSGNLLDLSKMLPESLGEIDYVVSDEFIQFLEKQENFLRFFDEATATNIDRQFNDWFAPILRFGQNFEQWFGSSVHTLGSQVNQQIINTVQEYTDKFTVWFNQKIAIAEESPQTFVSLLDFSKAEMERLNMSMSDSPTEMANLLTSSLAKLGYTVSEQFQLAMEMHNRHLDYFDLNSDSKIDRHATQWFAPIEVFQETFKNWWSFHFRALENDINVNVTKTVQQLMSKTKIWLKGTHFQQNENISVAINFINTSRSVVEKMVPENTTAFKDDLINSVRILGYNGTGEFEIALEMYIFVLDSLQNSLGLNVNRNLEGWQAPIKEFQLRFNGWQNSIVRDLTQKVNDGIDSIINSTMATYWKWFIGKSEQVAAEANPIKMVAWIDSTRSDINKENLPNEPSELGKFLKLQLENVGFRDGTQVEMLLEQHDKNLKHLDKIQGTPVARTVDKWHSSIISLQVRQDNWVRKTAQNVTTALNSEIEKIVQGSMENFTLWLEDTKTLTHENLRLLSLPEIQSAQYTIQNFIKNPYDSANEFALGLKVSLQNVGYSVPYKFVKDLQEYEHCLLILDMAINARNERALMKWTSPVLKFQAKLEQYKQITTETISNLTQVVNNDILTEMGKEFNKVNNWLERERFPQAYNVTQIAASMQTILSQIQTLLRNQPKSPSSISNQVKFSLEAIGYRVNNQLITLLALKENIFGFLDEVQGSPVTREYRKWLEPIFAFRQSLEMYEQWYSFCSQLQDQLSSNNDDIHSLRTTKKPEMPPTNSSGLAWVNFLDQNNFPGVSTLIKTAGSKLSTKHVKRLEHIIQWGLRPLKGSCQGGQTMVISGTFIKFSDFLNYNGQIRGCYRAQKLLIYAGDTVFIDKNLNVVGKELSVAIIAPKWRVLGNYHINLNGAQGETPEADNRSGADGKPGNPGGPGGSFVGLAGSMSDAALLKVTANGGDGGNGGNGVRGYNGNDGENANRNNHKGGRGRKWYLVVYTDDTMVYKGIPGGRGGNGGNGGVGGLGGKPGSIEIKSIDGSSSRIRTETWKGGVGRWGFGGRGGNGGRGGLSIECQKVEVLYFWTTKDRCNLLDGRENGANGSDGEDGVNSAGQKTPKPSTGSVNIRQAVNDYRQKFQDSPNHETARFIDYLQTL